MASLSFSVGDRITIKNSQTGDPVIHGIVEKLDIMRTLIRLDAGMGAI